MSKRQFKRDVIQRWEKNPIITIDDSLHIPCDLTPEMARKKP